MNRGLALHNPKNITISTSRVDVRFDRIFDDLRMWVRDNDHLLIMQLVKRWTMVNGVDLQSLPRSSAGNGSSLYRVFLAHPARERSHYSMILH